MGDTATQAGRQCRLISLVGPYLSGKTQLERNLERAAQAVGPV